jgi:hypothetical protein
MDKELARQLAYLYQQSSGLLVHTIWLLERHGTKEQAEEQRRSVAQALTTIGVELLYPIYHKYPDLEPPAPPATNDDNDLSPSKLDE